mmetsp:Transcript_14172/g.16219  ORF Transcript_14172/g.16219 Transcript_14172/m.16219 type:complete len:126 (-) Transcript_14172:59-436(-)
MYFWISFVRSWGEGMFSVAYTWVRFRNSGSPEPPVFISTGNVAYHQENETPLLYGVIKDVADAVAVIAESLILAIVVESFIHHFVTWSMGGGFLFNDPVVDVLLDFFRSFMGGGDVFRGLHLGEV